MLWNYLKALLRTLRSGVKRKKQEPLLLTESPLGDPASDPVVEYYNKYFSAKSIIYSRNPFMATPSFWWLVNGNKEELINRLEKLSAVDKAIIGIEE